MFENFINCLFHNLHKVFVKFLILLLHFLDEFVENILSIHILNRFYYHLKKDLVMQGHSNLVLGFKSTVYIYFVNPIIMFTGCLSLAPRTEL